MLLSPQSFIVLLVGAVLATRATSFQPPLSIPSPATTTSIISRRKSLLGSRRPVVLVAVESTARSTANTNIYAPDSSQPITPNQIKILRKEAAKRQARKTIAQQRHVGQDDNDDDQQQRNFLSAVCRDLEEHELCLIRGVCLGNRRKVFETAERLAYDSSVVLQRDVTLVDTQGHAVILYCPSADESRQKIILRSNYREGAWNKREKAPRDHRGQIIRE